MGRIRLSGRPGKRTDADGNVLGTYLNSLSATERKKLLTAYGLDEKDDFKEKNGLRLALDASQNDENTEVRVRPKRNVKPIQRLSPNEPTPPPSTAPEPAQGTGKHVSYEVDWNLTKELHDSISLGIVRDQLKASSKERASKQLNGLEKKHPAAICGVLCKDVANDIKTLKDQPTHKDPPLMVRLKCFPKASPKVQSPALSPVQASPSSPVKESPKKESLISPDGRRSSRNSTSGASVENENKTVGKGVRTRGRSRGRPRTFKVLVSRTRGGKSLGRPRLHASRVGYINTSETFVGKDSNSASSVGGRPRTRGGHPRIRGPGISPQRGRARGRPRTQRMLRTPPDSKPELPDDHSPSRSSLINGHASLEEAEENMEVDKSDVSEKSVDGDSTSFREPLPQRKKRGCLPKRFSDVSSPVAPPSRGRGRGRGRGSRGGRVKRENVGEPCNLSSMQDPSETLDIVKQTESSAAVPSPSSSGKAATASSNAEPVPCEICEQVNKQRPVFYFHGHQVCRVCSNFLTSTLRKLETLSDAACIYRNTCDVAGRYCRACRLHKFLRLDFDLAKFAKMRGYPPVVNDLGLDSLALPAIVHQARLDRFAEYAKYLESWRTERGPTLEFGEFTPIPLVTRTPPPPVVAPPPVKHRRPVWHEEEDSSEEEEENKTCDNDFGFDTMRAIRLADGVPFSCDLCENRGDEALFRVDDKITICSFCLKRYQALMSSDESAPSCQTSDAKCEDIINCEACFLERCKASVSPAVVKPTPRPSKVAKNAGPRTKSLFELRIPGDLATAFEDLCCVICRLKAGSTDGQLAFYQTNDKIKTEAGDSCDLEAENEVVCECCLWIYRWRVGEARAVEDLFCSKERSCPVTECYACLVQKCRTILPLFNDLKLPDWIKAVVFERLSQRLKDSGGSDSNTSANDSNRRVCKTKNATLPPVKATEDEEETESEEEEEDEKGEEALCAPMGAPSARTRGSSRGRSRGRGRGRGRGMMRGLGRTRGHGRSRSRGHGWSKMYRGGIQGRQRRGGLPNRGRAPSSRGGGTVRTKMPSVVSSDEGESSCGDSADDFELQPRRRRKRAFHADYLYSESEEEEEDDDDDDTPVQSRREVGSFRSASEEDSQSLSDDEGTQVHKKGNVVTMTRIVRAGGTKGPRIKQVSRHAATVFSRATKEQDEPSRSRKDSRSDQGSASPDQTSGKRRSRSGTAQSQGSDKLSDDDDSFDFDMSETVSFVAPQDSGRSRSASKRKGCGRCEGCRRRKDCGSCSICRLTMRHGKVCVERVCRQRRSQASDLDFRDQAGSTAWVTRLQQASGPKHPKNSRQMPPPINKVSGAPPSNTLWNTVPNLSRHIEEASCNAVYGNQEMDRIHYNFAERQATNLAWDGGVAVVTTRKGKAPGELCYLCGSAGPHKMIHCVSCSEPFHWFCLEYADRPRSTAETVIWLCRNCKPCLLCHHTGGVLTCVTCWKGFHARCLPGYAPAQQPNRNAWQCPGCAVCSRCGKSAADLLPSSGTVVPDSNSNGRLLGWSQDPSQCAACESGAKDGNACPVCQKIYTDDDQEMIQCSHCSLWVHAQCAGLHSEDYHALSRMNPRQLSKLIFACRRCEQRVGPQKKGSLQTTARNELRTRVQSLLSQLATREQEMREETRAIEEGFSSRFHGDSQESSMEGMDEDPSSPPYLTVPQVDGIFDDAPVEIPVHQLPLMDQLAPAVPPSDEIDFPLEAVPQVEVPQPMVEQIVAASHSSVDPASHPPVVPIRHPAMRESRHQQLRGPFLKELSEQMASAEPGSHSDPLRYGLKNLIRLVFTKMDDLARSDNYGLQYQTYTQLLSDFESYISKQLPWFDFASLRRKLRHKVMRQMKKQHAWRRRKHSTDLDASSESSYSDSGSESEDFARGPAHVELKDIVTLSDRISTYVLEADERWMNYWFRFDRHMNRRQPEEEPSDVRECILCRIQGETSLAGRLLYCGQDVWIHANCALWSNEVYETEEGSLRHVGEAVMRGGSTTCRRCHGRGASLTCCGGDPSCSRSYHFLCGVRAGCIFTVDRAFYCRRRHAVGVDQEEVLNVDDLAVCRRVLIHREGFRPRKQWTQGLSASHLQMNVGALFVDYLGRLDEASDSLNCFLCPVGLRCVRYYWSTTRLDERVPYRLTVRQTNIAASGSPPSGVRQLKRPANGFHFNSTTAHHAKGSSVRIVPMSPRQVLAETTSRRDEIDVVGFGLIEKAAMPGPSPVKQPLISHPMPAPPAEPRPEVTPLNLPRTDSLADRLQRMSRQMIEQKRLVVTSQAPVCTNDRLPRFFGAPTGPVLANPASMSASSNLWGGRKNRAPRKTKFPQSMSCSPPETSQEPPFGPVIQSVTHSSVQIPSEPPAASTFITAPSTSASASKSLIVHREADTKPLITSVRSLADSASCLNPAPSEALAQRFRTVHSSFEVPPLPPALQEAAKQNRNDGIWKASQSPLPSRVIPCAGEAAQRLEPAISTRPVVGELKRMAGTELRAPDGKRLRLMAPPSTSSVTGTVGVAPSKKVVMTRRLTDGKTLFVCVNSTGVCTPVSSIMQPTITAVTSAAGCGQDASARTFKIDRVVDRVIMNPPPPPQLDGCIDEDDAMVCKKSTVATPRKDPPKRKTRWIEERDQKNKWKEMFSNDTKRSRRRKNGDQGDAKANDPSEHLAAITRAKRKHDERRYRQATADVQDNFWLTFSVEGSGITKRICTLSPKLSWKEITSQVKTLRYSNQWRHPYIFGVDGWSQWGLNHRHLSYLIEQMEGAYMGYRHRFIYHRKKIDNLRELNAPPVPCKRGCARVEPYPREAWRLHETFSFLLCSINKMGAFLMPSQGGLTEEDNGSGNSSSAQAKLVSQPLATRLRLHSCRRGHDVDVYRSNIHCRGLFAMRSFVKDEIIIEYLGEVIRSIVCEERERRYQEAHVDCFMFRIDADWVIDATMKGNAARFINHSCEPNCYSRVITMPDSSKHIVILANKDIERGEEITYDYKFPSEDDKIPCHCGAQNCRRYLN